MCKSGVLLHSQPIDAYVITNALRLEARAGSFKTMQVSMRLSRVAIK
jgi:hypothetical protein